MTPPDRRAHQSSRGLVRLFGPLRITDAGGRPLDGVAPGRASLLLQRVAIAGGSPVEPDQIIDALWPDRAPRSASRTVAALVSRIRSALDPTVVTGQPADGYRLGVASGWTTDLIEFERFADQARRYATTAPALAASAAGRALLVLDEGRLLGTIPEGAAEWYDTAQRHIDVLADSVRRIAWEAEADLGRWPEVVRLTEEHLARDPVDETAARSLMEAESRLGDRGSALRVFERLEQDLRRILDVAPSPSTVTLREQIATGSIPEHRERSDGDRPSRSAASGPTMAAPIGREREWAHLLRLWERAVTGSGSIALVTGARGSGRTHMAESLRDVVTSTGGRAAFVRSNESDASRHLDPLLRLATQLLLGLPEARTRELLGSWGPAAADLLPELRPILPAPDRRPLSPDLAHHRARQLLERIFSRIAEKDPLLLVVDDLHRSTPSMLHTVEQLLEDLIDSPILMVGTVADDEPLPFTTPLDPRVERIRLGPLDRAAVLELARAEGITEHADVIWPLSHGHLHFAIEVINLLQRGVPVAELPTSFGQLVADLIDRWDPAKRELLGAAATIGLGFDLTTLEDLTGRPPRDLLPSIETAIASGYLAEDGARLVFANEAIHAALLGSLTPSVARRHHLRLADILADRPDRRAAHLMAADLPEEAGPVWLDAARRAQLAFANGDAERHTTAAIGIAEDIGDDHLLGEALLLRGAAREQLGDHRGAIDDHRRAEELWLRTGDRSLRARAIERIGWAAYYQRDREEAIRRAEEAVALPGTHPGAWALLGRVRHWSGDLEEAADAYRRALRELGDDAAARASVLSCLGALYAHADRFEEAITVLDEAVELSNEIGAFRPLLRTLFFRGLALANHGRLAEALTTLDTKSALLDRYGVRFYRARTNTSLAWVWRELGDPGRAAELSERALEQSLEVDDEVLQLEQELHARCALADDAAGRGDVDAAVDQLELCRRLLRQWLPFRWRGELRVVEIGARLGADDPEHLLAIARERRSAKYESLALHLLDRPEEASKVAAATGSMLLLAEVGAPTDADRARRSLLERLPRHLRDEAARKGRLFVSGR